MTYQSAPPTRTSTVAAMVDHFQAAYRGKAAAFVASVRTNDFDAAGTLVAELSRTADVSQITSLLRTSTRNFEQFRQGLQAKMGAGPFVDAVVVAIGACLLVESSTVLGSFIAVALMVAGAWAFFKHHKQDLDDLWTFVTQGAAGVGR